MFFLPFLSEKGEKEHQRFNIPIWVIHVIDPCSLTTHQQGPLQPHRLRLLQLNNNYVNEFMTSSLFHIIQAQQHHPQLVSTSRAQTCFGDSSRDRDPRGVLTSTGGCDSSLYKHTQLNQMDPFNPDACEGTYRTLPKLVQPTEVKIRRRYSEQTELSELQTMNTSSNIVILPSNSAES